MPYKCETNQTHGNPDINMNTMKPVCNDHLYYKIYYL